MTTNIIIKNSRLSINPDIIWKKNTTILATYYALYSENKHLNKVLLTFTIGTESITDIRNLRREFIKKLNSLLRKKAYTGQKLAYFSNIEFGEDKGNLLSGKLFKFNPHLHIQFFYEDIRPIEEAMQYIENMYKLSNSDITLPTEDNKNIFYDYIVKDYKYKNFSHTLELNKKKFSYKKALHTSSRKQVSNYIIKFLYKYLSKHISKIWNQLKSFERYEFILLHIGLSNILISTKKDRPNKKYILTKNSAIFIDLQNIKTVENDTIKNIT